MSRYAAAHTDPQGPGDARPTAIQIIKDEEMEGKLSAKTVVITGTSSGIGIETARALSLTGAKLFLTARNIVKAKEALADLFDPSRMELIEMDQTSLQSVRTAAKSILAKTQSINILINNAGIMAIQDLEYTKDGHELQFGVNHLSHFLFFELLKPALLAGATPELHSRVVVVSSTAHLISGINASRDYNFEKGGYKPWAAYGQSKTAQIYMANEIERRYGPVGLHALSLHPGTIQTNLTRHMPGAELDGYTSNSNVRKVSKSPSQGAATTVWAAVSKDWEGKGGRYLADVAEAKVWEDEGDALLSANHAKHAYSPELEGRLWKDSLKIVKLA